jgi:hypothetical protein
MTTDTPARLAKIKEIRENGGRLTEKQFRERICEAEVVSELTRRGLWLGDGRPRFFLSGRQGGEVVSGRSDRGLARPVQDGKRDRGFTFDDLWVFYSRCNSPKLIAGNKEKRHSAKRLIQSARLIRRALGAFRWTREVHAATPGWFHDLATDRGDDAPRHDDRPMIVGDLETAILAYTRDVERLGRSLLRGGRMANWDEWLFRSQWEQFAMKCAGAPLYEVAVRLFRIVFDKKLDAESYRRQCMRDASRARKIKQAKASMAPQPIRTKGERTHATSSGQKPAKKVTRRHTPSRKG